MENDDLYDDSKQARYGEWQERLDDLMEWEPQWYETALPVSMEALLQTLSVLDVLDDFDINPGIFPDTKGGITLEWNSGDDRKVVAIDAEGSVAMRYARPHDGIHEKFETENLDKLRIILDQWQKDNDS